MVEGIETRINGLHRVVVTGLGAVSPLGNNVQDTWQSLIEGKSGIRRISLETGRDWDGPVNSTVDIAGLVQGLEPGKYISAKQLRRIHMSVVYSTVGMIEAFADAGLLDVENKPDGLNYRLKNVNPERVGARIGTGIGGGSVIAEIEDVIRDKGDRRISPVAILQLLSESVVTVPSMILGYQGGVAAIVAACASANIAQGGAFDRLKLGREDVISTGGVEEAIHRIAIGGFNAMRALSMDNDNPVSASRPFNKDANGFVMGEGSGILIFETLEHALGRGAGGHILAEVVGYGETSDAFHDTEPSGEGARRAMRLALEEARIQPWEVDYINAHGTSTPTGDPVELDALMEVFGEPLKGIAISSTKSMSGHLLGGSGGLEAVVCIRSIMDGIIHPTINLHDPIKEGLNLVPNVAQRREIKIAMSNSFGFGGINSVLIFRRFQGSYERVA